jgi:hypothetical protein
LEGGERERGYFLFPFLRFGFPSTSLLSLFVLVLVARLFFSLLFEGRRRRFQRGDEGENTNLDRSARFSFRILSNPFSPRAFYLQKHIREKKKNITERSHAK